MKLSPQDKKRLLTRLKRAEGQVAAIRRMIDEDKYCVDVLVQIAAARGALGRAGEAVLRHHVETCVSDALASGDEDRAQQKIDELMDVLSRYTGIGG